MGRYIRRNIYQSGNNRNNTSSRNYRTQNTKTEFHIPPVIENVDNLEKIPTPGFISKNEKVVSSWNNTLNVKLIESVECSNIIETHNVNRNVCVPKTHTKKIKMNIGRDSWEYVYFEHILNLRKIFEKGIKNLNINNKINTRSVDFLDNFCIFLKKYSSGKISPYIENLNEKTEKMYYEFVIKRNEY